MIVREPRGADAESLRDLMLSLDEETRFMMLEPGERTTTIDEQEQSIAAFLASESKVMFVADDGGRLVGFVVGVGKTARRNKHAMSCVIGVLQDASGHGLGARLMAQLEAWAQERGFTRLELTVMAHNERAKRLYLARGFEVEGTRRRSLRVDGQYVDELYMSKLFDDERPASLR